MSEIGPQFRPSEEEDARIDRIVDTNQWTDYGQAMRKVIGRQRADLVDAAFQHDKDVAKREAEQAQADLNRGHIEAIREERYAQLKQKLEKEYAAQIGVTPEEARMKAEASVNAQRIIDNQRRQDPAGPPGRR